ncbi:MAG: OB-fold nucleic acid binding domain-containing protein [Nocardioides alkalitolerans]|jgi:hypothetical protein
MSTGHGERRRSLFRGRGREGQLVDQHTSDLRRDHGAIGRVTIAEAPDREPVELFGTLRAVTLAPRGGVPALEAELSDGTGVLTLIWLGRRSIRGIAAGRSISVSGRTGLQDGVRVMFNPRYELRP